MKKALLVLLLGSMVSPVLAGPGGGRINYYRDDSLQMKIGSMRIKNQINKLQAIGREYQRLRRYDRKRKKYLTAYDRSEQRLFTKEQALYQTGLKRPPMYRASLPVYGNTGITRVDGEGGRALESYQRPVKVEHGEFYIGSEY